MTNKARTSTASAGSVASSTATTSGASAQPASEWVARMDEAAAVIRERLGPAPQAAVVLGSGLGAFAEELENQIRLPYEDIPFFPRATVAGHAGQAVIGELDGVRVLALQGRAHAYEGHSAQEVAFPVRVLARLGVPLLVLTNAAGCVRPDWSAGELMRISDHINLSGRNPLVGPNDDTLGPRFPDLSYLWSPRLGELLLGCAGELGITLREGVYACMMGPSYETPAEVRMVRTLGADAVGMSTVPEAIAASHMGVQVVGISCLTNMAAGILDEPLSHADVTATANRARHDFIRLLNAFVPRAVGAI